MLQCACRLEVETSFGAQCVGCTAGEYSAHAEPHLPKASAEKQQDTRKGIDEPFNLEAGRKTFTG